MKKKKVLLIVNHRLGRSPGQRFRIEQYINFLEEHNYEFIVSNIISLQDDKVLYEKGNYTKKAAIEWKARKIRNNDLNILNDIDLVFIYREALLTKSIKYEKAFAESKAKVIFDFDDAIWLPNVSSGNKRLQRLKKPDKINDVLPLVDMVFAGNDYLAKHATQYNSNVKVIPTTIDTSYHLRKSERQKKRICIGWTGTDTTRKYLDLLIPVFRDLKLKYQDKIYFKIICDLPWQPKEFEVVNEKWSKDKEISQLEEIDIGVMPLTDDLWSRGKCGFKALQYMAMESIPVVSPVGVNKEIVENGVNGFLAKDEEEWVSKLSLLIDDSQKRKKMAIEARKTIEEKYSVKANQELYLRYFNELTEG